ncbi:hypothetical protein [Trichothermofontia sp.]
MPIAMSMPFLAGLLVLSNTLAACAVFLPMAPQPAPLPAGNITPVLSQSPQPSLNWSTILGTPSAPPGWQVSPCDNPVLLCVQANGQLLGTIAAIRYPVHSVQQPGSRPPMTGAEIPFLQTLVADHMAAIQQDRQGADPTLTVTAIPPTAIAVGPLSGLRYGHTTTHPSGDLFERSVGYMATDGEMVYVFVTGVNGGEMTGSFRNAADLEEFLPHLDTLIQQLSL